MTEWTDLNEGGEKISLMLQLSEETQALLEDREETMNFHWKVVSVKSRKIVWGRRRRHLSGSASEEVVSELMEVKEFDIQLVFSYPEYIS